MRVYACDIYFGCLEAQALAKLQFSFKVFFITQHYLATIAFIPDI